MTTSFVDIVIARLLGPAREGTAYTNDPNDKGGPTKCGITIPFLSAALGRVCTAADIEALTVADASNAYASWMLRYQLASLPTLGLMDSVTDYCVHSGEFAGVEALERALGTDVDGLLGPNDLGALKTADPQTLVILVTADRVKLWSRLMVDPTQRVFASDWLARLDDVLSADNAA